MRPIQSEQLDKFAPAFLAAQRLVVNAPKDSQNPHFRSRFTSLTSVSESCKGALHEHGITVIQNPFPLEDNNGVPILNEMGMPAGFVLRTVLMHESGQYLASELPMCPDMRDPQKVGSAMTYSRRYALAAMTGVCPEDDDAEAAMGRRHDGGDRQDQRRSADPPAGYTRHPRGEQQEQAPRQESHGPPRNGKQLFAWVKDQEAKHGSGLLKALNSWGKLQELSVKMADWTEAQVGEAHGHALQLIERASHQEQPAKANGHKEPRSYEQLVADAAGRMLIHSTTLNRELLEDAIEQKLVAELVAGKASQAGSDAEYQVMEGIHRDNPGWVLKRLIEKVNVALAAKAS